MAQEQTVPGIRAAEDKVWRSDSPAAGERSIGSCLRKADRGVEEARSRYVGRTAQSRDWQIIIKAFPSILRLMFLRRRRARPAVPFENRCHRGIHRHAKTGKAGRQRELAPRSG